MSVELVYEPALASYRLSDTHPLRPERFVLAVELMRAWDLVCPAGDAAPPGARQQPCARVATFGPASIDDLLAMHAPEYVHAVQAAGARPEAWMGAFGIGPGDTPAFLRMHEASALVCGATMRALDDVVARRVKRSFSPAGGLHHAHRAYAAGFCVYNDCAVAISVATRDRPGLRVAYVDVDAHHGDGVQAAFYDRADVLTVSVHESGHHLFPGTGGVAETGTGAGAGFAVNVPLPPGAGDAEYAAAFERVIAPAVRAYAPDVLVAQLGADSHLADPLTDLATTVRGQWAMTSRITALADEVCDGLICATGGGGYDTFSAVPRAWACALASLLGVEPRADLPDAWRLLAAEAAQRAGEPAAIPRATFDEPVQGQPVVAGGDPAAETERTIEALLAEHPLLR